jgi:hypothetical protein
MSPTFVEAFGRTRTHFSWVDPQLVVPTQAYVRVNARNDPEVGASLFELAFPPQAQPRFEVVAAGSGVFYMVSDSPHINALRPAVNPLGGGLFSVTVGMYTNFVLIAHFGAMYCARNGTHRLEWAVRVGVPRVPALILEAATSAEASVALGIEGFHVETLAKQRRPPTIADFGTIAGVRMPMRISRYGWTVHTRGLHRA